MKLMGLKGSVHWISWFLVIMIYLVLCMTVFAVIIGKEFSGSDVSLLVVFLLFYGLAVISFCFMISTFVQKGEEPLQNLSPLLFSSFPLSRPLSTNAFRHTAVSKPVSYLALSWILAYIMSFICNQNKLSTTVIFLMSWSS